MDSFSAILANPAYHDLLSIVKGFRNGMVYGAKIRFPHALVMTFLFRDGPLSSKLKFIFTATKTHSRNLAFFVTIYKTLMILQRRMLGKEQYWNPFLAGCIGGYMVFGKNTNINNQIVLYLFSRITIGLAKLLVKKSLLPSSHSDPLLDPLVRDPFPVFASLVWGTVMYLFRYHRETLQGSLQASMQYLYNDSDVWDNLRNWIWVNK
ncbi:Tim17/Tim22/Tim23/Pmp24 family-domain-containing protein [Paraphysoderma sedebokerense]|nr:Tim17/Tim22/Tim23/Pmp24 family-domain-containing protein [Paraphysoderma sedebokerense]